MIGPEAGALQTRARIARRTPMAVAPRRYGCDRPGMALRFGMPLKTKRWDDPREPDDGARILVCRYRPRGLRKEDETWDVWHPELGPSKALHAAVYTRDATPIPWPQYRKRYLTEQKTNAALIESLAARV